MMLFILYFQLTLVLCQYEKMTADEILAMKNDYFNFNLKSNNCKVNCIDQGNPFCANGDYSGGYCCTADSECVRDPPGKPKLHCSDSWPPGTPDNMRYFVCPNESECGTRDMFPNMFDVLTREVEKYTDKFVQDDVCSYVVHPPAEFSKGDKLYMRIDKIQAAKILVMKSSKGFEWDAAKGKEKVEERDQFIASYGEKFIITGVAETVFRGSWRMKIWVVPKVPIINHTYTPKEDDLEKFLSTNKIKAPDPGSFKKAGTAKPK